MANPTRWLSHRWTLPSILLVLWMIVIRQLGVQWSFVSEYRYGWGVPLLMIYLLKEAWNTRPPPDLPSHGLALSLLVLGGLLLLPVRIVQEANPLWRLSSLLIAMEACGLSLVCFYLWGGRGWIRHFGFLICFFLISVPWPTALEVAVIQNLTRANTSAALEALAWIGIPALQRGNVIQIPGGVVGIEEACSGIKSVQTAVMVTLFLGELNRCTAVRRGVLFLGGLTLAFITNVIRTFTLVMVCAHQGTAALQQWHDPTGLAVLGITFAALAGLAYVLRSRPAGDTGPGAALKPASNLAPASAAALLLAFTLGAEGATEAWYRAHEHAAASLALRWDVRWPDWQTEETDAAIMARARQEMRYDEGKGVRWTDPDGARWQVYHFRWLPSLSLSSRARVQLSKSHRPEICLPATGMKLTAALGLKRIEVDGLALPFQRYEFNDRGTPVFVFFSVWEEGTQAGLPANMREDTRQRLRAALKGSRNAGQRLLEIAVWGYPNQEEAERAVEKQLRTLISVDPSSRKV